MKLFGLTLSVFLLIVSFGHAQTDTFPINVTINLVADPIPPSTPTLLSVTPVAETQIDLTWSSSTDNIAVVGYRIFRDGTVIASTTQISYSDAGLVASTTYAYEIQAFDGTYNYSTSSNSIATTTLSAPPVIIATSSQSTAPEGTAARVVLDKMLVQPDIDSAILNVTTARPSRIEVRWGKSSSYELGYVVGGMYTKDHQIELGDLEPGTTYQYEVVGYTPYGKPMVIDTGSFRTLGEVHRSLPANVNRFVALAEGADVRLFWELPEGVVVSKVRIVRSHLGFPEHPQDGAVIYQGTDEEARDTDILKEYSPVYYTAFLYTEDGRVSSGAVALVYTTDATVGDMVAPDRIVPVSDADTPAPGAAIIPSEGPTTTIAIERLDAGMRLPESTEVYIFQDGNTYTFFDIDIALRSDQPFVLRVPKESVSNHLKSLIGTLYDPSDHRKAYSFLLRINADHSAYEATIAPLEVEGGTWVQLEIYDYQAYVVATYQTPLSFSAPRATEPSYHESKRMHAGWYLVLPAPIVVLLVWLLLWYRRRAEDNPY